MANGPKIVAHRGYSSKYRENSPEAWIGAMAARADYIEVDLRVTADGAVVCIHDADLQRLAGSDDRIADVTAARLAGISAGGFAAAPTIEALFATVPAGQALLFDIKDESPGALDRYIAAFRGTGRSNLVFGLHALASLEHVRAAGWSGTVLGFLRNRDDEETFFEKGGNILRLWEGVASDAAISAHVGNGRDVWITTGETEGRIVGDFGAEGLRRMANAGASGFLVNDPLSARRVFEGGSGAA